MDLKNLNVGELLAFGTTIMLFVGMIGWAYKPIKKIEKLEEFKADTEAETSNLKSEVKKVNDKLDLVVEGVTALLGGSLGYIDDPKQKEEVYRKLLDSKGR